MSMHDRYDGHDSSSHLPTESAELFIPDFLDDSPESLSEEQKRHKRILQRRYKLLKKRQRIEQEVTATVKKQDVKEFASPNFNTVQSHSSANIGLKTDSDFENLNKVHRWNTNTNLFQKEIKTKNSSVKLVSDIDSELHKTEVSLRFLDEKPPIKPPKADILVEKGQRKYSSNDVITFFISPNTSIHF